MLYTIKYNHNLILTCQSNVDFKTSCSRQLEMTSHTLLTETLYLTMLGKDFSLQSKPYLTFSQSHLL